MEYLQKKLHDVRSLFPNKQLMSEDGGFINPAGLD